MWSGMEGWMQGRAGGGNRDRGDWGVSSSRSVTRSSHPWNTHSPPRPLPPLKPSKQVPRPHHPLGSLEVRRCTHHAQPSSHPLFDSKCGRRTVLTMYIRMSRTMFIVTWWSAHRPASSSSSCSGRVVSGEGDGVDPPMIRLVLGDGVGWIEGGDIDAVLGLDQDPPTQTRPLNALTFLSAHTSESALTDAACPTAVRWPWTASCTPWYSSSACLCSTRL